MTADTTHLSITFLGIREESPGAEWRALLDATSAAYRSWYLQEGYDARPTLHAARRQLERHMPELVPVWRRLVALADEDETIARLLTLWNPPGFLPGCSQAAGVVAGTPTLVRNYDYHPDFCERVVYSSAWTGRRVIGTSDCLWGLLDGMNDAGLAASLTYGGRPGTGSGFGIPLVVRYLLEQAETLADAREILARVPVHMSYNLTLIDRNAEVMTAFVAPGSAPEFSTAAVATNHRGMTPEHPEHARRFRSVERQAALHAALTRQPENASLLRSFLRPPLYNTAYQQGFGTLYTAAYRPAEKAVDYLWPTSTWRRTFDSPNDTHTAHLGLGFGESVDRPRPVVQTDAVTPRREPTNADELAADARAAVRALAASPDPVAFTHLLHLSQLVGESLGQSARSVADAGSWADVAHMAGTSRQAAWSRWSGH